MLQFLNPKNYFLSQVHQPFFLFGVIFSVLVMLEFMLVYKGVLSSVIDVMALHSYTLIYIVFTQFFTGFIFTTFPRFTQSKVIEPNYYLTLFVIQQLGSFVFLIGSLTSVYIVYLALALLLISNFMIVYKLQSIYLQTEKDFKSDPWWILVGFYAGFVGHILFLLFFLGYEIDAVPVAFNLYLIYVTFAVAQRMVPFFSHSFAEKNELFAPVVFAGLVVKVLLNYFSLFYFEALIDIALGVYIFLEIKRWNLDFKNAIPILLILHISLFWLVISLVSGGLISIVEQFFTVNFMQFEIHALALGFVTTMLIGFGTRVTLGHSGQPPQADTTTIKIFYLLQAVVLVRILLSLILGLGLEMFWLFDVSVALWLVLFIFWGVRFGPVLINAKKL